VSDRQLFGVLVRVLGMSVIFAHVRTYYETLMGWAWPVVALNGYVRPVDPQDVVYCLLVLTLGLIMVRAPEWVAQFAWPKEPEPEAESSN